MSLLLAQAAVNDANIHFDKLYSYRIPAELAGRVFPGSMVLVPFGRGSKARMAVVLAVGEVDESDAPKGLKTLYDAAPEDARLTPDLLELVRFLKERTFCTWFEAVKAVIPYGAQYRPAVVDGRHVMQGRLTRSTERLYTLAGVLPEKPKPGPRQLAAVAALQNGPLTARQLDEVGISRATLDGLVKKGVLTAAEQDKATPLAAQDPRRRAAQSITDERHAAPMVMFFRTETILSWTEMTRVNRADDDEDDGQQLAAANDMDELAVAPDGQSTASRVKFDLDLPSAAHDDLPLGPGEKYPEWNYQTQRLQPEHCVVQRYTARDAPPYQPPAALRAVARRMRRRLEALRSAPARLRGRTEGDDIDVDAWIRYRVESGSGPRSEAPPVYVQRVRAERDLATLLLADLSLSTDAYATQEARVIDVIRDALHVFGEALAASSDAFEMLGFSSVRRSHVRIQHLKAFDEAWDSAAMARVNAIKPGYYTRMGAALRHATARLLQRGERQRLLIILTDGKPNDLDVYEGRYGLEDTRHAVREARALGLTPFCITIDAKAHDYLPHLFGSQGYALVHRPQDLVRRLASAYAGLTR